ncbi:hypothetical protein [Gorillibacterium sp. sgz5001074]|uniref:hypothetical protein n=1 Tax=Gorillibacterium sp. sgz5001074 TaxID=3446695 RepID=UPI003F671F51
MDKDTVGGSTPGESLEQAVAEQLEFGHMEAKDPEEEAARRVSPPYVVRIRTERDPILEETAVYRNMAEEVDDRYDAYLKAAGRKPEEHD